MRYELSCTLLDTKKIQERYPSVNKYKPIIDYPYQCKDVAKLTIEVNDFKQFIDDIQADVGYFGIEIAVGKFSNDPNYYIEIKDCNC